MSASDTPADDGSEGVLERYERERHEQADRIAELEDQVEALRAGQGDDGAAQPSPAPKPSESGPADPWGPDTAWGAQAERARDLGDTAMLGRLWEDRQRAKLVEGRRQAEERRQVEVEEAAAELDEVQAHDQQIRDTRAAGDEETAGRLERERPAVAERALALQAERQVKAAYGQDVADRAVRSGWLPDPDAFDDDPDVQQWREELDGLEGDTSADAQARRLAIEGELHAKKLEQVRPHLDGSAWDEPAREPAQAQAQTATGEYRDALARGDLDGMYAANARRYFEAEANKEASDG